MGKEVIMAQMCPRLSRPLYFTDSKSTDKAIVLVCERTSVVVSSPIAVSSPLLSYPMSLHVFQCHIHLEGSDAMFFLLRDL